MALLKRGILGGLSGKVGNVVGSSWKGLEVLRTLPLSVANPNTASQQAQRGAFGASVAFAQMILTGAIKPLWDRFVQAQSGFNAWISANISEFTTAGLQTPAAVVMSRGNLHPEPIASVTPDTTGNDVTVTWTSSGGSANDDAYLVCWNEDTDEAVVQAATADRSTGTIDSAVFAQGVQAGNTIHAWLMFRSDSGDAVSDSNYDSATA